MRATLASTDLKGPAAIQRRRRAHRAFQARHSVGQRQCRPLGETGWLWAAVPQVHKETYPMGFLQFLIQAFDAWLRPRQDVRGHERRVAYGPRWSRGRPSPIGPYSRRRSRR